MASGKPKVGAVGNIRGAGHLNPDIEGLLCEYVGMNGGYDWIKLLEPRKPLPSGWDLPPLTETIFVWDPSYVDWIPE